MKVEHGDIENVKIELDANNLEKLVQGEEYRFFDTVEIGVRQFVYNPSSYLCGELSLDGIDKSYFFLTQDKEVGYRGFGEQFQVLKGTKQTRIPDELTGCGERTIGQVIDKGGYGGILSYFLDYDNVINPNGKTEEVVAKEERGFSEVEKYAIKSEQLAPIVREALFHSFGEASKRRRAHTRLYIDKIFEQINQIGVHSNKLFPDYANGWNIFPETNHEISDFIEGLKKQFVDFSVYKLVLSGDKMDGRVFDRINKS